MNKGISLLDCTLRDGCYIVNSMFGVPAIKGIIKKMQDAGVEIIECGWLKNQPHEVGSAFYHVPQDLEPYLLDRKDNVTYVVMIDWDRYDLSQLPERDGKSIDAVRVVFPHGKHLEGVEVGKQILEKGYDVFFQAANTLAYSNEELEELAETVNKVKPTCLSIVDTFGAMYEEDLERIVGVLERSLLPDIKLGLHSHNNQQLSFSLTTHFVKLMKNSKREIVVDASLCGMGRGAGNATTELVASYLNRKCARNYDMDAILDAIDMYLSYFLERYQWGYSTAYFIAGMYCCHVNNIAYLQKNHRAGAHDMRSVIESIPPEKRRAYDYNYLESKYIQNQAWKIDDGKVIELLGREMAGREVLIIAPGKSTITEKDAIDTYILKNSPLVIMANAINPAYKADYAFFINLIRYNYAKEIYPKEFAGMKKILLSNVKAEGAPEELVVNFSRVNKLGWKYFDNAVVDCLRLLDRLCVEKVALAGFDGFKNHYNETYADELLPTLNPDNKWDELNAEILDMFRDFKKVADHVTKLTFVTSSIFDEG